MTFLNILFDCNFEQNEKTTLLNDNIRPHFKIIIFDQIYKGKQIRTTLFDKIFR